jgi:hypothetical protein
MKSVTFTFIEDGHASRAIVTAETFDECKEKYFLKYPERKDSADLQIETGDQGDINFYLVKK